MSNEKAQADCPSAWAFSILEMKMFCVCVRGKLTFSMRTGEWACSICDMPTQAYYEGTTKMMVTEGTCSCSKQVLQDEKFWECGNCYRVLRGFKYKCTSCSEVFDKNFRAPAWCLWEPLCWKCVPKEGVCKHLPLSIANALLAKGVVPPPVAGRTLDEILAELG